MELSFYKKAKAIHSWNPSTDKAREIQDKLSCQVCKTNHIQGTPTQIAGADVSFDKKKNLAKAAVVVLRYSDLSIVDRATSKGEVSFPYIPGYLSFREAPPLLKALDKLNDKPEVILCDSQGYAHPRRFGLACHLGILTDIPTIGVAKSKLIGEFSALPAEKGSSVPLYDQGEQIGLVLRTRTNVKPLFVSIGHKISLEKAKSIVLDAVTKYKLPETTREADRLAAI